MDVHAQMDLMVPLGSQEDLGKSSATSQKDYRDLVEVERRLQGSEVVSMSFMLFIRLSLSVRSHLHIHYYH